MKITKEPQHYCTNMHTPEGRDIPAEQLRFAFAGDSIPWGEGLLDESFVSSVDDFIRNNLADTILHSDMSFVGDKLTIYNRKFYKGNAAKLMGMGAEATFTLAGDELSIVQGLERNNAGAALIELYVDGVLHDKFSNYNELPCGSETKIFTGDGQTVKFDLGRCFTYNHTVTIDGVQVSGKINESGYGAAFDSTQDYMIIRKYGKNPENGEIEVHHVIWFENTPAYGANIIVTFNYGENISYTKSTVGEVSANISSALESCYGDDVVSFDPAKPSGISSGLDFRYTDERAVKTWKFDTYANRTFKFKIKNLDSRASSGTPYFIINFATNRFHHLMNAGIGGWTAEKFYTHRLLNFNTMMKFKPDIIFLAFGTNDDWEAGRFVATRQITGVTEEQIRRYPALFLKSCKYFEDGNYVIETANMIIRGVGENSITIDNTGASLTDIKKGDILAIGDYHGDNRAVAIRVIDAWDISTNTATFREKLISEDIEGITSLSELEGKTVRVKRVDRFINTLSDCIDGIRHYNPGIRIGLIGTGLSNFYERLLMGYTEKIIELAHLKKCFHVDSYKNIQDWQYSQEKDSTAYIGCRSLDISTGAAEYPIVDSSNLDIHEAYGTMLRNFSVKVNGVERLNRGCFIDGGYALAFKDSSPANELTICNWNNRTKNTSIEYCFIPARLKFTFDIPARGDTITIKFSSAKWSSDDCHIAKGSGGDAMYSKAVINSLVDMGICRNNEY